MFPKFDRSVRSILSQQQTQKKLIQNSHVWFEFIKTKKSFGSNFLSKKQEKTKKQNFVFFNGYRRMNEFHWFLVRDLLVKVSERERESEREKVGNKNKDLPSIIDRIENLIFLNWIDFGSWKKNMKRPMWENKNGTTIKKFPIVLLKVKKTKKKWDHRIK